MKWNTPTGIRNIKRANIVLAVLDALLLIAILALPGGPLAGFFGTDRLFDRPVSTVEPPAAETPVAPTPAPAPAPDPAPPPAPEPATRPDREVPADRDVMTVHVSERGDTFFGLAQSYWGDETLWPDLYLLNRDAYPDPDFIRPGQRVTIFRPLGDTDGFSVGEKRRLADAHLEVYQIYRQFAESELDRGRRLSRTSLLDSSRIRLNRAYWSLYIGLKFDPELLESPAVRADDARVVRSYLSRYGDIRGTAR